LPPFVVNGNCSFILSEKQQKTKELILKKANIQIKILYKVEYLERVAGGFIFLLVIEF